MDQARSQGPATVEAGDGDAVVFTLDPAGLGRHGSLPASWDGLAAMARVTWLRLPAVDSPVAAARSGLDRLLADGRQVHLVAVGDACQVATLIAVERPAGIRSVLLVDPDPGGDGGGGELLVAGATVVERGLLTHRTQRVEETLVGHGIRVEVVTSSDAERNEHGPPLSLGHPRVVTAVRTLLTASPVATPGLPTGPTQRRERSTTTAGGATTLRQRARRLWWRLRRQRPFARS